MQVTQNFHILAKITQEPPFLPPIEHAGAHVLNAPLLERKYARVYLGDPESRDAAALRRQISKGAREALEEQYWDILERTLQARPTEARLGGDPSISNKVRAFLLVRYYRNGEWEDRVEVRTVQAGVNTNANYFISLASSRAPYMGSPLLSHTYWPLPGSFARSSKVPTGN